MKPFVFISALVLGACASNPGTTAPAVQAAGEGSVTAVNERGERVRCERVRDTGSRMTTRVCRTEAEWERIEENARQVAEDAQDRNLPDPMRGDGTISVNPRDR